MKYFVKMTAKNWHGEKDNRALLDIAIYDTYEEAKKAYYNLIRDFNNRNINPYGLALKLLKQDYNEIEKYNLIETSWGAIYSEYDVERYEREEYDWE